jgi:hypothetical protein
MPILISVVALVIIIVIIGGALGRFPNVWEWVGIVFAVVGVAIGVPSLLQRIFGRPKLVNEYDKYVRGQERGLIVFLKNPPLGKKSFLKKLGVRRDTVSSLSASFRISGGGKVIVPIMHCRIYTDDDPTDAGSWRIALPPTFSWSTSVMIAMWDDAKKKAIVPGDTVRGSVELSAGLYRMDIIYLVDGQPENEFREFIVGENADDLVWIRAAG